MSIRRALVLVLLSAYVLFLLDLALLRFPSRDPVPNVVPLRSIIGDWRSGGFPFVVNFLGNIAAFVPIGMIPPLAWPRRAGAGKSALFSLAFSAMIESVQYTERAARRRCGRPHPQYSGGPARLLSTIAIAGAQTWVGEE